MLERIAILLLVVVVILVGWGLLRLWRAHRLRSLATASPLALAPLGRPAVVAFSTPTCGECHARQAPALARLATLVGDSVTIRSLSALEHPELVARVGILTVPATVVIDAAGTVRHLNLGYAPESRLHEQVRVLQTAG
jgi:hypothetical protein